MEFEKDKSICEDCDMEGISKVIDDVRFCSECGKHITDDREEENEELREEVEENVGQVDE